MKTKDNRILLEFGNAWDYEKLHGTEWEEVSQSENPPEYSMWYAAQLAPPDEKTHGPIYACKIIEQEASVGKSYFVSGFYQDGEFFTLPVGKDRKVASYYMLFHRLSANMKEWDALKDSGFKGIKEVGQSTEKGGFYGVLKFPDGFWIKQEYSSHRVGPFSNKALARMYAYMKKDELPFPPSTKHDRAEKVQHLTYPVYAFSYKYRGVDCLDLVCAETDASAMKNFDFQWHVFDNVRPTKQTFNNIAEVQQSLKFMKFTDIEMIKLQTTDERDEYVELAEQTGNPATNPQLRRYCRNPRFRYLLGVDVHTGRAPITINY